MYVFIKLTDEQLKLVCGGLYYSPTYLWFHSNSVGFEFTEVSTYNSVEWNPKLMRDETVTYQSTEKVEDVICGDSCRGKYETVEDRIRNEFFLRRRFRPQGIWKLDDSWGLNLDDPVDNRYTDCLPNDSFQRILPVIQGLRGCNNQKMICHAMNSRFPGIHVTHVKSWMTFERMEWRGELYSLDELLFILL